MSLKRSSSIKVLDRFGGKHGDMAKGIAEAISEWIEKKIIIKQIPYRHPAHLPGCRILYNLHKLDIATGFLHPIGINNNVHFLL